VDPVHNIPTTYSDSANVHIASTINFNVRDVYRDNYSPGPEVANHQWLKDKVGTESVLFLVVI
jgi:hypothetical protein